MNVAQENARVRYKFSARLVRDLFGRAHARAVLNDPQFVCVINNEGISSD